jgi:hypothetical protein
MLSPLRLLILIAGLVVAVLGAMAWSMLKPPAWERAVPVTRVLPSDLLKYSAFPPGGAQDCNMEQYEDWSRSQHAQDGRVDQGLRSKKIS